MLELEKELKNFTVLVVEDDEVVRERLKNVLSFILEMCMRQVMVR